MKNNKNYDQARFLIFTFSIKIMLLNFFFFFFFFFFSRDQLTKQKKNVTKNPPSCSLEIIS